ncbi:MAG: hypothetical protein Q8L55_06805 [Phycisphaerales bacterium]|nr:hypothetical protein [Phycisphaerales bacterium]
MVFAGGGGPGWIQVGSPGRFTINLLPTPAAASALGLGGLFASRRRR